MEGSKCSRNMEVAEVRSIRSRIGKADKETIPLIGQHTSASANPALYCKSGLLPETLASETGECSTKAVLSQRKVLIVHRHSTLATHCQE